jgi:hypothetical protein
MRRVAARAVTLLVAAMVLFASGVVPGEHLFCRMMGRAVAQNCCPAKHESVGKDSAQIEKGDCCERVASPDRSVVASAQKPATDPSPAALVACLSPLESATLQIPTSKLVSIGARAPPVKQRPRYIEHCALLI